MPSHDGGERFDEFCCRKTCIVDLNTALTRFLNVSYKSKDATLGRWYGTARVSKRPPHKSAACLRARYRTNLMCSDLNKCPKNSVNALLSIFLSHIFLFWFCQ